MLSNMAANEHTDSDNDAAVKAVLRNLEKLRRTKASSLEEDQDITNGSVEESHLVNDQAEVPKNQFHKRVPYRMVAKVILSHALAALAIRPLLFEISWACVVYFLLLVVFTNALGSVMAAHRYYSHRSFKANLPLSIIMIIAQTACSQGSAFFWARQHRLHHKYSDTDADPHNAARGFFFSHIGWTLVAKHPAISERIKEINVSDLEADKIIMFQRRHYYEMFFFFGVFLPPLVPVYLFGDTWWNSILTTVFLRVILDFHASSMINSWAHHFGTKPYDQSILPVETILVSFLSAGDGWHNYHHTFPWDYRASEYGAPFNLAANLIDMFAYIGWATELKVVTPEMIATRARRTGDVTSLRNPPQS